MRRLMVTCSGLGLGALALGSWCTFCDRPPQCPQWGPGEPSQEMYCGAEDLPSGCKDWTKRLRNCKGGIETGWEFLENYHVAWHCLPGLGNQYCSP